jgi:hypothetical protein
MRVTVVKLKAEHLEELLSHEHNAGMRAFCTPEYARMLETRDLAYSVVTATGRVVLCGGVAKYWETRGEAWAFLDQKCKEYMLGIHRAVKKFLSECGVKRIEASVYADYEAGHRWVRLLGFNLEAERLKSYFPGGKDAALYAMVRD